MHPWYIHPDYANGEPGRLFRNLETTFAVQGETVSRGPLGTVLKVSTDDGVYYAKLNLRGGKGVRHWLGRARLRGEWDNLQNFVRWNIPTTPPVAFGIEKKLGVFHRGALVTKELENTIDLAKAADGGWFRFADRAWIAGISRRLAAYTRIMHSHRFAHGDLKWRNILVTQTFPPQVYLIDCPDGRFWIPPFLQYRKTKDLACLDKLGKHHLSRTQRLKFFMEYTGRNKLSPKDKKQIRRILGFFSGRE